MHLGAPVSLANLTQKCLHVACHANIQCHLLWQAAEARAGWGSSVAGCIAFAALEHWRRLQASHLHARMGARACPTWWRRRWRCYYCCCSSPGCCCGCYACCCRRWPWRRCWPFALLSSSCLPPAAIGCLSCPFGHALVQVDKPNACKVPPKRANSPAGKDDGPVPHTRSAFHMPFPFSFAIPAAFCVTFNHKMAFSCQRLPQQLPEACHAHQLRVHLHVHSHVLSSSSS